MKNYVLVLVALLAIASIAVAFSRKQAQAAPAGVAPEGYDEIATGPLKFDDFWAIIDHSAEFEADTDLQSADIHASLMRLSPAQIADFERMFDETMRNSYTWDLWGAAYVANGGASDDGFEYFRCWLISKGRRVFEQVSSAPDGLADIIANGETGEFEFEEFAYLARDAWSKKTGKDWNEVPTVANMAYETEPKGTPFSEDPEELQQRFPKLWRRFGG